MSGHGDQEGGSNGLSPAPLFTSAISSTTTHSTLRHVKSGHRLPAEISPWLDTPEIWASSSSASRVTLSGAHSRTRSESSPHHPLQPSDTPDEAQTRPPLTSKETEVFVHHVQPKDSLAGLALKYGIDLAELRKTNKLWSNDSIHLRKVIYIPLSGRRYLPPAEAPPLISFDADETPTTQSFQRDNNPPIERVPLTKLSFFPPPRFSPSSPRHSSKTLPRALRQSHTYSLPNSPHNSPPFPSNNGSHLPSLLNVFPSLLPRPRLDPSRVSSFDSIPSSTSSPRESLDDEVEMDWLESLQPRFRKRSSLGTAKAPTSQGYGPLQAAKMIRSQPEPIRGMQVPPATQRP